MEPGCKNAALTISCSNLCALYSYIGFKSTYLQLKPALLWPLPGVAVLEKEKGVKQAALGC